jgi:formate-dependent nitrite reductase cytochrome c552 subunit
MTTIQIDLPDAMARAARDAGLLTPQALQRLLADALDRQQAARELLQLADQVAAAGIEPMSMEEINAEVKAARAEHRAALAQQAGVDEADSAEQEQRLREQRARGH